MEYEKEHPVSLVSAIRMDNGEGSTGELDPALLISQLPTDIQAIRTPMSVRFKSDIIQVDVDYNTFMSKCHRIEGDLIKIGYRKLELSKLKIEFIYKVSLV
jgi:hypothetical protein